MEFWGIPILTYLLGIFSGAGGKYLADRFTDQRKKQESKEQTIKEFKKLVEIMPKLLNEMKIDFSNPEHNSIRKLVVIPSRNATFLPNGESFFPYYETDHAHLKEKMIVLENCGYLIDITPNNAPIYRITEPFWDLVQTVVIN